MRTSINCLSTFAPTCFVLSLSSTSASSFGMRRPKSLPLSSCAESRGTKSTSAVQGSKQNFFVLTASKDHIDIGKENGYIQQKHPHRIEKLRQGDYVVLYAGKAIYGSKEPYQRLVAVCQAIDGEYEKLPRKDGKGCFYRKKVNFLPFEEKEIRDLVPRLSFVKNKSHWGFYFMSGFIKIDEADFMEIMN
jgi:hypothetical protein